jgi:hypothetical protein
MSENTPMLSVRLSSVLTGGFFRPLARPSAPLYVDCADRLERASDDGDQLSHSDAMALIHDALVAHPSVKLEEDEGGQFADVRHRAGQVFNRLLEAGWLEERPASLDERWVVLSPRLSPLLGLLRNYAEDDLAELKDFAATVRCCSSWSGRSPAFLQSSASLTSASRNSASCPPRGIAIRRRCAGSVPKW